MGSSPDKDQIRFQNSMIFEGAFLHLILLSQEINFKQIWIFPTPYNYCIGVLKIILY